MLRRVRETLHLSSTPGAENLLFDESVLDVLEQRISLLHIGHESQLGPRQKAQVTEARGCVSGDRWKNCCSDKHTRVCMYVSFVCMPPCPRL